MSEDVNEDVEVDPGPGQKQELNRLDDSELNELNDSMLKRDQGSNEPSNNTGSLLELESNATESDESESSGSDSDLDSEESDSDEYNSKSLSDIIIEEIQQGIYTCLVCTLEIDSTSKVWSCFNCYRVYDLDCIKDWAKRGTSTKDRKWRCPSCNIENNKIPTKFTCWCGRVENPQQNLVPFSCGNLCGVKYENCIHSCSSVCHPANHPVCGAMGPVMACHCGNHQRQVPCLITPYKHGWTCDDTCNIEICDLGHTCKKSCHSGFCGACTDIVKGKCYCGKHDIEIKCFEKYLQDCNEHCGISYCDEISKLYYDCGIHFDEIDCQPLVKEPPICKYSPSVINTCYCGKNPAAIRSKCTDPIPECDMVCGKLLECGCQCRLKCHEGACECFAIKTVKCQCANYEFSVSCKSLQQGFIPKCRHKCDALLNCRRHYHREECCGFEKIALERERLRKKQMRNKLVSNTHQDIMTIESPHICTRPCNRLKSCQKHHCDALCHPGPCAPCLESTNDDLICNCGKTVIQAPVRCGTKMICTEQCIRPKSCGHKPEIHHCHETGNCPVCTERLSRTCECGRTEIPNVLCSGPVPKCSYVCLETKDCGHSCLLNCSKSCESGNHSKTCSLTCGKFRISCPHRCKLKCHFDKKFLCDERVCEELVEVECECGRITKKIECGSSQNQQSTIGSKLHCDDDCEQYKRDKELKNIFLQPVDTGSIGTDSSDPDYHEETVEYSEYVISTFIRQNNWCSRIEQFLRDLISNGHKKFHHFSPLNAQQRRFIHELSQTYKLYSESLDHDPKRTVFVYITEYTKLPSLTIQQYIDKVNKKKEIELLNERLEKQKLEEELFNGIIIEDLFFGVTEDKLISLIEPNLSQFKLNGKVKLVYIDNFVIVYDESSKEEELPEEENSEQDEEVSEDFDEKSEHIAEKRGENQRISIEIENNLYLLMKFLRNLFKVNSIAFDCKLALIKHNQILKIDSKLPPKPQENIKLENLHNQFDVLNGLE